MIIIFSALKSSTIMVLTIIFQCDYKSASDRGTVMIKNDNYFLMCQKAAW